MAAGKTGVSQAEQERRNAQSAQAVGIPSALEEADRTAQLALARQAIGTVNLDEVTFETIKLGYIHWEQNADKKWTGKECHVELIKDVDSELLFQLMQYQDAFRNAAQGIDPEALQGIRNVVWKAWKFTDEDVPFVDVQRLPLMKLVTLAAAFFSLGSL